MAIEIVSFPMNNGDVPVRYVNLPEGTLQHHAKIPFFFKVQSSVLAGDNGNCLLIDPIFLLNS